MKIKKDTVQSLFIVLILFLLITPDSVKNIINGLNSLLNIFAMSIFVFYFFLNFINKRMPTFITFLFLLLQIWLIFVTIENKPIAFSTSIFNGVRVGALCLIFEYYSKKIEVLIKGCYVFYSLMIFINFLTVVLSYPNGLYIRPDGRAEYFLGYHNAFILYFLPALMFSLLNYKNKYRIPKFIIIFLLCVIPTLLEKSSTTTVALFMVFAIFFVLDNYKKVFNRTQKRNYTIIMLVVYFVLNIMLFVLNNIANIPVAKYFIENILGKDINFTGRTIIWETALIMILKKPIHGYGIGGNVVYYGDLWYGHNEIIEYLLEGGIVAASLYLAILIYTLKKIINCGNRRISIIMISVLSAMLLFFLTEASTLQHFVPIYLIGCNCSNIRSNSDTINDTVLSKEINYENSSNNAN